MTPTAPRSAVVDRLMHTPGPWVPCSLALHRAVLARCRSMGQRAVAQAVLVAWQAAQRERAEVSWEVTVPARSLARDLHCDEKEVRRILGELVDVGVLEVAGERGWKRARRLAIAVRVTESRAASSPEHPAPVRDATAGTSPAGLSPAVPDATAGLSPAVDDATAGTSPAVDPPDCGAQPRISERSSARSRASRAELRETAAEPPPPAPGGSGDSAAGPDPETEPIGGRQEWLIAGLHLRLVGLSPGSKRERLEELVRRLRERDAAAVAEACTELQLDSQRRATSRAVVGA